MPVGAPVPAAWPAGKREGRLRQRLQRVGCKDIYARKRRQQLLVRLRRVRGRDKADAQRRRCRERAGREQRRQHSQRRLTAGAAGGGQRPRERAATIAGSVGESKRRDQDHLDALDGRSEVREAREVARAADSRGHRSGNRRLCRGRGGDFRRGREIRNERRKQERTRHAGVRGREKAHDGRSGDLSAQGPSVGARRPEDAVRRGQIIAHATSGHGGVRGDSADLVWQRRQRVCVRQPHGTARAGPRRDAAGGQVRSAAVREDERGEHAAVDVAQHRDGARGEPRHAGAFFLRVDVVETAEIRVLFLVLGVGVAGHVVAVIAARGDVLAPARAPLRGPVLVVAAGERA